MNVLQIVLPIFGIIGLAGGIVGYFGKARGDSIIAYQATENGLLKDTNTRLEKEAAADQARIASLEEQNATLKELAQGSPQLVELTKAVQQLVTTKKRGKA